MDIQDVSPHTFFFVTTNSDATRIFVCITLGACAFVSKVFLKPVVWFWADFLVSGYLL